MIYLSAVFFVMALIAALLGFGGGYFVFQVVFFTLVIAFVVTFLMGVFQRSI